MSGEDLRPDREDLRSAREDLRSAREDLRSAREDLRSAREDLRSAQEDLRSAPIPPVGDDDHVRGPEDATVLVEYADFECPYCGALTVRLAGRRARRVFRHFPVRSSHPRAWAAACAAEAAARQGRFWEMHDSLFADQARLEDPHLWERARSLGLDLERFEADRRSEDVRARVERDFRAGVRGGVVSTPTVFVGGTPYAGQLADELLDELLPPV